MSFRICSEIINTSRKPTSELWEEKNQKVKKVNAFPLWECYNKTYWNDYRN